MNEFTFAEAQLFLKKARPQGIKLGLERMQKICAALNHPENQVPCFHIAGTNGKGSVSSFIATSLALANFRVGLFTSPYLERFNERIRVLDAHSLEKNADQGEISEADFAAVMFEVKKIVESIFAKEEDQPTEFEILTAAAFLFFSRQNLDYVVLECGLGGRLDSTNVVAKPICSIITALGYDHQDYLGASLEEIAAEKAGIIKNQVPVILYDPEFALGMDHSAAKIVRQKIESICALKNAPLDICGQKVEISAYSQAGQKFFVDERKQLFQTKMLGVYQPYNANLAIKALENILSVEQLQLGIAKTIWPARLELVKFKKRPEIILDGAHNPQGARALVKTLEKLFPKRKIIILLAIMADKEITAILTEFKNFNTSKLKAIICTELELDRSEKSVTLIEKVKTVLGDELKSEAIPDLKAALAFGLASQKKEEAILCICGSLYLMGEIRPLLLKNHIDDK